MPWPCCAPCGLLPERWQCHGIGGSEAGRLDGGGKGGWKGGRMAGEDGWEGVRDGGEGGGSRESVARVRL